MIQMTIHQGSIFWLQTTDIPHPHVIIQADDSTATVCALTSNLKRISLPGNILLEAGEANLPKPSVVEVSKISTVDQAQLGGYIGSLSEQRMQQIQAGIRFVQTSFFDHQERSLDMNEHSKGQPPQPTRSLKQFDVLIGEWEMVGTHPLLPDAVHGHSTFEWLRQDALLVWRFEWESGSQIPNAFSVIGHDDEGGPCSMLYTDERGVSRIYHMSLDGSLWKQWRDSPNFSQRMTGTFSPDGSIIRTQGELLRDGTNWEPDLSVIFTRKV